MSLFSALTTGVLLSIASFIEPTTASAQSTSFTQLWNQIISQNRAFQLLQTQNQTFAIRPTPTATPKTTATPRPTTSATPKPTSSATLKPSTTATPKPTTSSSPVSTTSVQDYLLSKVNEYRKSLGLYQVKSDSYTCNFAQTRAKEIVSDFSHAGFDNRIANHTLPYPSYSKVTENIAMTTAGYQGVVDMWINSPGHAANMQADTPYVCIGVSGNYYAYEGWKP